LTNDVFLCLETIDTSHHKTFPFIVKHIITNKLDVFAGMAHHEVLYKNTQRSKNINVSCMISLSDITVTIYMKHFHSYLLCRLY